MRETTVLRALGGNVLRSGENDAPELWGVIVDAPRWTRARGKHVRMSVRAVHVTMLMDDLLKTGNRAALASTIRANHPERVTVTDAERVADGIWRRFADVLEESTTVAEAWPDDEERT